MEPNKNTTFFIAGYEVSDTETKQKVYRVNSNSTKGTGIEACDTSFSNAVWDGERDVASFKYGNYSKRMVVSVILRKMNVSVCPYCNRQYIFTLTSGKVRPQLDHYFPKSTYPYLALSLYNMVPSCSVCNMTKSALDTVNTPIPYPFDDEMGSDILYEIRRKKNSNYVRIIQGLSNEFFIRINTDNATKKTLALNQVGKLHLNELYNEHKDYVRDIIRLKNVNTPERIEELLRMFPLLFDSDEDVRGLMYMQNIQKDA